MLVDFVRVARNTGRHGCRVGFQAVFPQDISAGCLSIVIGSSQIETSSRWPVHPIEMDIKLDTSVESSHSLCLAVVAFHSMLLLLTCHFCVRCRQYFLRRAKVGSHLVCLVLVRM